MTLHYPDISAYQAGIPVTGPAVCIKATEGTAYASSDYLPALRRAAAGTFIIAYHFLHAGNTTAQAAFCHRATGATPLMLDVEPTGTSRPTIADAAAFLDAYHAAAGTCHLTYLPCWYWEQLGKPSLQPLTARGQNLVSSNYTTHTADHAGAGWQPYGGMTPAIWQYTDRQTWNGQSVDFNCWRGTLPGLITLATGGTPPPPDPAPPFPYPPGHYLGQPAPSPFCHSGYYGGPDQAVVHTWQAQMTRRGWVLAADGHYGPQSEQTCRSFQADKHLAVDGRAGADTWAATFTAPIT